MSESRGRLIELIRRFRLFFGILWRESPAGGRMSLKLSWEIAKIMH